MDTIDTTKICTQFTAGTAPATTSGLTVVNALKSNFNNFTYTHPTTSGNKHIPSGGSSGKILVWSADGTAALRIHLLPCLGSECNMGCIPHC